MENTTDECPLNDRKSWGELLLSGTLEKRGMSMVKNWKRRYFEIYETKFVYYTTSAEASTAEGKAKGVFVIDSFTEFGHSKISPFCFYIKSDMSMPGSTAFSTQKLYMRSETYGMKEEWMAALAIACKHRRELAINYPRQSLLASDFTTAFASSTKGGFENGKGVDRPSSDSGTAEDITGYSLRPRTWRVQKGFDHSQKKVSVKILGTQDINNKKGSSPSLYCILSVGNTMVQTKTVQEELNPKWGESFVFDISHSDRYLNCEVWDSRVGNAKPVFMGHCVLPLFEMSADASYRKKCPLGKRSHKSHVSGSVVLEVRSELKQHDLSRDLFRAITRLPEFSEPISKSLTMRGVESFDNNVARAMESELKKEEDRNPLGASFGGAGAGGDNSERRHVRVKETPTIIGYPWEERFDASTNYNYYFNKVSLVSQWEKPKDFDENVACKKSVAEGGEQQGSGRQSALSVSSQPPGEVHPDFLTSETAIKARTRSEIEECVDINTTQGSKGGEKDLEGKRSTFVRLGSNLRMTLSWSGSRKALKKGTESSRVSGGMSETEEGEDSDGDDDDDDGIILQRRVSSQCAIPTSKSYLREELPFCSSMPPKETEILEDMTFHVVLHSPLDVVNSVHQLGVLILTNYRLIFCSEDRILQSLDPSNIDLDYSLNVQCPIQLIGSIEMTGSDLVVKTKDSRCFWFDLAIVHLKEIDQIENDEGVVMGNDGAAGGDGGEDEDLGMKKRNQMNTGIKALYKGMKPMAIANKVMGALNTIADLGGVSQKGDTKGDAKGKKVNGLKLQANGKTALENFLLNHEKWDLFSLQIAEGVLSDDGKALARFSHRLRYRILNAQFETKFWLRIHEKLIESFRVAYEIQNSKTKLSADETETIEMKLSALDYIEKAGENGTVGDGESGRGFDNSVTIKVSRGWINDTHNALMTGWGLYNIKEEFKRLNVPDESWRISTVNEKYEICDTYPNILCVPKGMSDDKLSKASKFRSKGRLPSFTWRHPVTKATMCRCAQPMVGLTNHRSSEDEDYLEIINKHSGLHSGGGLKKYVIIDARPKINAQANQAGGKGFENTKFYSNCEIIFMGIGNIHTMRKSVDDLSNACCERKYDGSSWLAQLDANQWLYHVHKVLRASIHIAHLMSRRGISCLVHCSDGWDRTSQLCALAEIMMDPYYRTIKGFCVLVEKDWLAFGHKFSDRCGFHKNGGHMSHERSPIFIQFMDCVHQLVKQCPNAFEYTLEFVKTVCIHSGSGYYGNFLFNTHKERAENRLRETTISLWSYVNRDNSKFVNCNYDVSECKDGETLIIDASPKKMCLWEEWFMVWHDAEYRLLWQQQAREFKVEGEEEEEVGGEVEEGDESEEEEGDVSEEEESDRFDSAHLIPPPSDVGADGEDSCTGEELRPPPPKPPKPGR